jgi:hypothetical protein
MLVARRVSFSEESPPAAVNGNSAFSGHVPLVSEYSLKVCQIVSALRGNERGKHPTQLLQQLVSFGFLEVAVIERTKVKYEITVVVCRRTHIQSLVARTASAAWALAFAFCRSSSSFGFGTFLDGHKASERSSIEVQTRDRRGSFWSWGA